MNMVLKALYDRAGNMGLMLAILTLPLAMAGGIAIDYSNLTRER